ncbi:uncharacterized protein LOC111697849 [Eurytemora carolleeae]|uniref:uncharacterized protein LOC111697849 n=1 Tax=Eurytemora carolleeae TaxID=1294199 RepID=UPI000C76023E|nr:uncharacterized protein LOC111697849 [Eurytemora carolleeae]|eukprot:XP_023323750.1 uncharacterized protein LOC111697849 [Eurytemora affinis]
MMPGVESCLGRVSLKLEEWILENICILHKLAVQEKDESESFLTELMLKQLEEVEDAELLVSRVLFSPRTRPPWQDRRCILDCIPEDYQELTDSSEASIQNST